MPKLIKILIISAFLFLCVPAYAATGDMPQIQNPFDSPKLQISLSTLGAFSAVQNCKDDDSKKCVYWIGEYIAALFKYAIGAVGILAAVVLMVGGIIWLTSGGNQTRVGEAKSWIGASLTGLIIALSSYLILYQINPELTKIKPIKVAIPEKIPEPTGQVISDSDKASDSITRSFLEKNYITINKANCKTITDTNCTSVANLPQNAINGLIALKNTCDCAMIITGGTEIGVHATHGPNKPIIDLSPDTNLSLRIYSITGKKFSDVADKGSYKNYQGKTIYMKDFTGSDGTIYTLEYEKGILSDTFHHWHIIFK